MSLETMLIPISITAVATKPAHHGAKASGLVFSLFLLGQHS